MTDTPTVRVVAAEIMLDGRYLLTQRMPTAVLPLLWEFPGGRVRQGESDGVTLQRSIVDRIGVNIDVAELLLEKSHDYGDYSIVIAVYRCKISSGEPINRRVNATRWVRPEEFSELEFPPADRATVELLLTDW